MIINIVMVYVESLSGPPYNFKDSTDWTELTDSEVYKMSYKYIFSKYILNDN